MIAANVFDSLGLIVSLPGARWRGKHSLFDEARRDETAAAVDKRHTQALMLCRDCPVLGDCQQWFTGLKPSQKPPGVIAGRIHTPKYPKAGGHPASHSHRRSGPPP
jgi:WhiB family redox-sensing transcriptional regulator